jgi:hypothetical protein
MLIIVAQRNRLFGTFKKILKNTSCAYEIISAILGSEES